MVFPKPGHFITAWEVMMLEQHNYLKEYLFFKDLWVILDGSAQLCHKVLRFLPAEAMELGLYRAINNIVAEPVTDFDSSSTLYYLLY